MSPLRLEEEVNTALNSGQTYRQVGTTPSCAIGLLGESAISLLPALQGHPKPKEHPDADLRYIF